MSSALKMLLLFAAFLGSTQIIGWGVGHIPVGLLICLIAFFVLVREGAKDAQ